MHHARAIETARDLEAARIGAAVDVGSNSVHLLVAEVRGHDLEPLLDESVFLGLARRVDADGLLGREARVELARVLAGYAEAARARGATRIVFLGTEPLRRAVDASRAVMEIEQATSVGMHVISHEEEASLTLVGVTGGRRLESELAVVDIGGGSTEVVDARPGDGISVDGIAMGSARLTAAIVEHDPPSPRELVALRVEAAACVGTLALAEAHDVVAVGGTASNLVKILEGGTGEVPLTRARIADALEILLGSPSDAVAERYVVNPLRARLLPAGAAILDALLEHFDVRSVRVVDRGLREGAVLAMAHAGASWRDRLPRLVAGWDWTGQARRPSAPRRTGDGRDRPSGTPGA